MISYNRARMILNSFLEVPSVDPDDARRRKLLNIILAITGAISLLAVLTVLILGAAKLMQHQDVLFILMASFASLSGSIIIYLINRYRSGSLASSLFLLLLMIVIALADDPFQLVNGRSLYLFMLPIIIAGILLGSRATFVFYALSLIEIIILTGYAGLKLADSTIPLMSFLLLTTIIWLSARGLEQVLHDLRTINANLDKVVTERTHALAQSLTRERIEAGRNQAILNSIADGVVVFNADHVAMLVNPALSRLTETPIKNLTGVALDKFIQTRDLSPASQKVIRELIEHPEGTEAGARIEWGKKTLSVSIARVQDTTTNEGIGTVSVFRDITREAELEKMKTTFVAVVSHELRTPLNAIMGHAEMLKESIYGPINEKQSSVTERIMVNTQRLLAMVGDLLDEAQMRAGKLSIKSETFKTSSLLENMHNIMDKIVADQGLYLTDELDPAMPETITGDPQRLQQILINLVNNSAKFTEKGGIHVRILRPENNRWKLEVTDTGLGIPEQEIPFIFETFRQVESSTTRQHGGFGLGLSIVKQLVELMKGEITVKSELNKGSTFDVDLPL